MTAPCSTIMSHHHVGWCYLIRQNFMSSKAVFRNRTDVSHRTLVLQKNSWSISLKMWCSAAQTNLFEMETPYQGTSVKDNHTDSCSNHPSRCDHWNMGLNEILWEILRAWSEVFKTDIEVFNWLEEWIEYWI